MTFQTKGGFAVLVKLNVPNRGVQLELQVESPKDAVRQLSAYMEIFSITTCGLCGSVEIRFERRSKDSIEFFGMKCMACGASLDFGQHKEGDTLFAKLGKGERGWYHYEKGVSDR